ncbi:deoxyribodipyrimidine photo-lyase [Hoeflea prorocentri]|uniref:Deoxyribodipyrimidine photo-lyase n=2 Tax=Hoeflea prorocentri TaxID=1922333 RepID=A0A9X3UL86_9HYPH|nr:deoxyribodipyrimidine photo-lyase [Hoeflea prorocentri]MCY6382689.1 deoxyribodipyrimidine photo-lyase [Hoeflea prorocentri]MDA5400489.1 deoxyribodipyrimidine photo-lyase [Hoeflea prorocentri]
MAAPDENVIFWFRQDLRLADNPALLRAVEAGRVLCVFILDDETAGDHRAGGASRWWLHNSLTRLNESLDGRLNLYRGRAGEIIPELVGRHRASGVYWNRCYEPWRVERDTAIKSALTDRGVAAHSDNASLLWEPWEVLKGDGTPYRVFTPFYRKGCLQAPAPRKPLDAPKLSDLLTDPAALSLDALDLLPSIPWHELLASHWTIGEEGARARLEEFLEEGLEDYKEGRNFPARANVSRLSPHLHFGEISPNAVWYMAGQSGSGVDLDHFRSELGWREFSHSLLYHFPDLPDTNLQASFSAFPWHTNDVALKAWQRGQTGIPIVDAGMRELWQTGYVHNRVRMIVGSFLVKNLMLDWRSGERWFYDCLVDADLANNSAGWQWIAGCGADAAPYFRIFNPVTQGQRFDADGAYTRRFVPELAALPDQWLFNPWDAPQSVLSEAGVRLGDTYPLPIVDLKASRERALEAYKQMKAAAS